MSDNWVTATEAAQTLGVSEKTVSRRAKQGQIKSKKQGKRRLYLVDTDKPMSDSVRDTGAVVEQLRSEVEHLREKLDEKDKALEDARQAADEASQRHDTIVLQLTMQVEQRQRLLDYHRDPWYRRIFRHRPGKEK